MTLKEFLADFDMNHPDFSHVPDGFPDCLLDGLTSAELGTWNAILTLWQLAHPPRSSQRTRVWQDPKGYQYLAVWQNAALLRVLVRKFTLTLPLTLPLSEHRLKAQMDDEARSVKRNIEEGWKRPTTSECLTFAGYSQASLEELRGDVRDCETDGFLKSIPGSTLKDKGFDLRVFKGPRKGQIKGEPTDPSHPYSRPLATLDPHALTYEIFMELINKTDWLLRRWVESLEHKLEADRKGYQIEQSRIRSRLQWRR